MVGLMKFSLDFCRLLGLSGEFLCMETLFLSVRVIKLVFHESEPYNTTRSAYLALKRVSDNVYYTSQFYIDRKVYR